MIIGTDADFDTNVEEGYLMCEYNPETLMSDGTLNMEDTIRLFSYFPEYVCEEIGRFDKPILMDVKTTPEEIWELYQNNKEDINEMAGREEDHQLPKNIQDVFKIASDVDGYMDIG